MLQGSPEDIPSFIGFIKREVSRRCTPLVGWNGDTMWSRQYWSTALPTASAQINCLRYVASQSVKEGLVERPEQWPGVHCAQQLWTKKVVAGTWLDGTRYGKARYKQSLRPKNRRRGIDKSAYTKRYEVRLSTIPPWGGLSKATLEGKLVAMHRAIVEDGRRCRGDKPALGANAVMRGNRRRAIPIARPPWFEERRRMVCWSHPGAVQTKRYLAAYWEFQLAYRQASEAYLAGDDAVAFPPGAFKPSVFAARRAGRQPLAA